jgi:hypothetical protein
MGLMGNARLLVRGEQRFIGPLQGALRKSKELSPADKRCATLLTEGRSYIGGGAIEILLT